MQNQHSKMIEEIRYARERRPRIQADSSEKRIAWGSAATMMPGAESSIITFSGYHSYLIYSFGSRGEKRDDAERSGGPAVDVRK